MNIEQTCDKLRKQLAVLGIHLENMTDAECHARVRQYVAKILVKMAEKMGRRDLCFAGIGCPRAGTNCPRVGDLRSTALALRQNAEKKYAVLLNIIISVLDVIGDNETAGGFAGGYMTQEMEIKYKANITVNLFAIATCVIIQLAAEGKNVVNKINNPFTWLFILGTLANLAYMLYDYYGYNKKVKKLADDIIKSREVIGYELITIANEDPRTKHAFEELHKQEIWPEHYPYTGGAICDEAHLNSVLDWLEHNGFSGESKTIKESLKSDADLHSICENIKKYVVRILIHQNEKIEGVDATRHKKILIRKSPNINDLIDIAINLRDRLNKNRGENDYKSLEACAKALENVRTVEIDNILEEFHPAEIFKGTLSMALFMVIVGYVLTKFKKIIEDISPTMAKLLIGILEVASAVISAKVMIHGNKLFDMMIKHVKAGIVPTSNTSSTPDLELDDNQSPGAGGSRDFKPAGGYVGRYGGGYAVIGAGCLCVAMFLIIFFIVAWIYNEKQTARATYRPKGCGCLARHTAGYLVSA